jgi:hypothetical protein
VIPPPYRASHRDTSHLREYDRQRVRFGELRPGETIAVARQLPEHRVDQARRAALAAPAGQRYRIVDHRGRRQAIQVHQLERTHPERRAHLVVQRVERTRGT